MNCDNYKRMLYLSRDGELSNREVEELTRHLQSCESCRLERERIGGFETTIRQLRLFTPVAENPELITDAILSSVRSEKSKTINLHLLERLLDMFSAPQVRIAASAFILLTTGTFLFQYITFFANIHALELAANSPVREAGEENVTYAVKSEQLQEIVQSREARQLLIPGAVKVRGGEVIVNRSDIASFLRSTRFRDLATSVAATILHLDKKAMDHFMDNLTGNVRSIPNHPSQGAHR